MAAAWTWLLLPLMAYLAPVAQAQITPVTSYPVEPYMQPMELIAGPDGKMWFSGRLLGGPTQSTKLAQMGLDGTLLASRLLSSWSVPSRLTAGPDGNVWVNTWDRTIIRVSPAGGSSTFTMPSSLGAYSSGISAGPDDKVWMVLQKGLARIDPDGTSVAYPIPTPYQLNGAIIQGPDGQMWFSNTISGRLNRLDPITGSNQFYDLQSAGLSLPNSLALGSDGQIWFTVAIDNRIGRINPLNGQIVTFTTGLAWVSSITAGPDGNMWYVSNDPWSRRNVIGRITPQGVITEYPMAPNTGGASITAGPDGKLWYIETVINPAGSNSNNIATFGIPATVTATVTGTGGSITPLHQVSRTGLSAAISVQPDPDHLVDTVMADRCSPLTVALGGSVTTASLTGNCSLSIRFTQPQCSARPRQGFVGHPVLIQCDGLPDTGTLSLPGADCGPINAGQALCTSTIGAGDGSGTASDALGYTVALPAQLSPVAPAVCQARPDAGFANTPVELLCTGLPPVASLTVSGAHCDPPDPEGNARCQDLLMGSDLLSPEAVTTLDDGTEARQPIHFQTLPNPICHAEPNPAHSGASVSILCSGVPAGSVATLANALCLMSSDGHARCQGTAGRGLAELGLNPALTFELNGATALIVTPLALFNDLPPPGGEGALAPVPALGAAGLGSLVALLLLGVRRQRQCSG